MIALYVHPKNSNHLRSHSRAIMALDHNRLGLENKSGRIVCVRQVYNLFYKILPTSLGTFYTFYTSHHISGETVAWGAVFIIQTLDRSQFCNTNCTHSIFRTIKAIDWSIDRSIFIVMCNLQKRLIHAAFWLLLQTMFMNDWKQMAHRLKLQKRLLTINKRKIIRWNYTKTTIFIHEDKY